MATLVVPLAAFGTSLADSSVASRTYPVATGIRYHDDRVVFLDRFFHQPGAE